MYWTTKNKTRRRRKRMWTCSHFIHPLLPCEQNTSRPVHFRKETTRKSWAPVSCSLNRTLFIGLHFQLYFIPLDCKRDQTQLLLLKLEKAFYCIFVFAKKKKKVRSHFVPMQFGARENGLVWIEPLFGCDLSLQDLAMLHWFQSYFCGFWYRSRTRF